MAASRGAASSEKSARTLQRLSVGFARLPPVAGSLRRHLFAQALTPLLEAPDIDADAADLKARLIELEDETRQREEQNTLAVLEQYLRYCFLGDAHIVLLTGGRLPVSALPLVHRFSARSTWVGILEGPLDANSLMSQGASGGELGRALAAGELRDRDRVGLLLGPHREALFDVSTGFEDASLEPISRRSAALPPFALRVAEEPGIADELVLSITAEGDDAETQLSGDVGPGVIVFDRWLQAEESGLYDLHPAAHILYRGLDDVGIELAGELRGLVRINVDPVIAAHQLEDRYGSRVLGGTRSEHLFRAAVDHLGENGALDRYLADPLILPENVRTPEELDYIALGQLKLLLQSASNEESLTHAGWPAAIAACREDAEAAASTLSDHVRVSERRLEHRIGSIRGAPNEARTHCIFHAILTGWDPNDDDDVVRCLGRQASMLSVLNSLGTSADPVHIELRYRLFTTQAPAGELNAVFEIEATVTDCGAEVAEALRESFGELVHTTFLGMYGLSFSFAAPPTKVAQLRLLQAEHNVRILKRPGEESYVPFTGRPDWGHLVDYLRSLERPVALEMSASSGGYREREEIPDAKEPGPIGSTNSLENDAISQVVARLRRRRSRGVAAEAGSPLSEFAAA